VRLKRVAKPGQAFGYMEAKYIRIGFIYDGFSLSLFIFFFFFFFFNVVRDALFSCVINNGFRI